MPSWRDAYPSPTDGEPKPDLAREDEDLWFDLALAETALDRATLTWPVLSVHRHDLCGHDCLSGACTQLEAICIACEFVLQDERAVRNSRGRHRNGA